MSAHWDLVLLFMISAGSSMLLVLMVHLGWKRWLGGGRRAQTSARDKMGD